MDQTKQKRKLTKIEKQIAVYLTNDRRNWAATYELMRQVRDEKLYETRYHSFTQWVNNLAEQNRYHVSTLWNRFKAGNVYEEYAERQHAAGSIVPSINEVDISPDTIALVGTIAGRSKNTKYTDELMDKALKHEMSRADLRSVNRRIKADRAAHSSDSIGTSANTNIHTSSSTSLDSRSRLQSGSNTNAAVNATIDSINGEKGLQTADDSKVTAAMMVDAFKCSTDWLDATHRHRKNDFYRVIAELPLKSGTSHHARRMDECVLENITDEHADSNHVNIHTIENKVSKSDLIHDKKMGEYADYGNYMWLCVPPELVEAAEGYIANDWGILVVGKNRHITVVKKAGYHKCLFKDQTLTEALTHSPAQVGGKDFE